MLYIGSTLVGNATHVVANVLTCNTLSPHNACILSSACTVLRPVSRRVMLLQSSVKQIATRRFGNLLHDATLMPPCGTAVMRMQVKGTAADSVDHPATITPESVADDLWGLYCKRDHDVWSVTRS